MRRACSKTEHRNLGKSSSGLDGRECMPGRDLMSRGCQVMLFFLRFRLWRLNLSKWEAFLDISFTAISYFFPYVSKNQEGSCTEKVKGQNQKLSGIHVSLHFSNRIPIIPNTAATAKIPRTWLTIAQKPNPNFHSSPVKLLNQISRFPKTNMSTAASRQNSPTIS